MAEGDGNAAAQPQLGALIEELLCAATAPSLPEGRAMLAPRNLAYARNRIHLLLGCSGPPPALRPGVPRPLRAIAADTVAAAAAIVAAAAPAVAQALGVDPAARAARLLDALLPLPDAVDGEFDAIARAHGPDAALAWFHALGRASGAIESDAPPPAWEHVAPFGALQLSINDAKPEKDPAAIGAAAAAERARPSWPRCALCIEHEGLVGGGDRPVRATHRMIELRLGERVWYFQYSPYAYFRQHAVVLRREHEPMVLDARTIDDFDTFLDWAPSFFIGANADLPIVGGSILTHDHYQAGRAEFPVERAAVRFSCASRGFPDVNVAYLDWPVATLRLSGPTSRLKRCVVGVMQAWSDCAVPALGIQPRGPDGERHNAVAVMLRRLDTGISRAHVMLRNNRCDAGHPGGVFHAHAEHHHLKHENIGLIETMGLAILPGRLRAELAEIAGLLDVPGARLPDRLRAHAAWFVQLRRRRAAAPDTDAARFVAEQVGVAFAALLDDCGVFKGDAAGMAAAREFCAAL